MACEIRKYTQQNIPQYIRRLVHAQLPRVCKHKVLAVYVRRRLATATHLYVAVRKGLATRSGLRASTICGFALLEQNDKNKFLKVDVLCSNMRYGGKLLDAAETLARHKGDTHVRLNALGYECRYQGRRQPLWKYYENKGYTHRTNDCRKGRATVHGSENRGYRMSKCLKGGYRMSKRVKDGNA